MAVAITAGSILLGWQYRANCRLRQELAQLREESNAQSLVGRSAIDATIGELEQLHAEHSELLRLGTSRRAAGEDCRTGAFCAAGKRSSGEQAEELRKQKLMATAADIRIRLKDLAEQRERLAQGLERTRPKRPQGEAELQLLQGLSPEEVEALGKDPAKLKALMESPQAQDLRETAKSSSVLDAQIATMSAVVWQGMSGSFRRERS
jgi:hypothetical protein